MRPAVGLAALVCLLGFSTSAFADTTVNFEQFPDGTTITNQYADLGGTGQGVVFGPLPGNAGDGLRPLITTPPAGQAHSGTKVANIDTCDGCEFPSPNTVGTFTVARSHVSVYVGYLGPQACNVIKGGAACAHFKLLAFDASGTQIATTASTLVREGGGYALLSVSTPSATIVGFKVAPAVDNAENGKNIVIDDLTFDTPSTPAPPDFTLTPASANVSLVQGGSTSDTVAIGRLGGSTGNITFTESGALPAGVHLGLAPNPAGTATTMTLTADANAPPTTGADPTITITGTPGSASAGTTPRSFTLSVGVRSAFDVHVAGSTNISVAACAVTVPVEVTRDFRFAGPVSLSVSGLPAGVTGSFAPAQATFPNGAAGQTLDLTLVAPNTGQLILAHTATIHASAASLGDRTATFTVGGTCPVQYDPEVISMQITQGTQLPELPHRDPGNPGAPVPYASVGQGARPGSVEALAKLAAFKATEVLVYADLKYGPPSGLAIPAVLRGYRYTSAGKLVEMAGSPILPVSTPGNLVPGLAQRVTNLQDGATGLYTFVLPASWESGKIKLETQLLPAQATSIPPFKALATARTAGLPGQPVWGPCTSSACLTDGKFTLSEIPFLYTFSATVRPVAMIATNPYDATLPDPETVFQWARVATPVPLVVEPYAATIDIGGELTKPNDDSVTLDLMNLMRDYVCNHGSPAHGWDVGVQHNGIRSAQSDNRCRDYLPPGTHAVSFAMVNSPLPLTSVTHELFHLFGLNHASACNGADQGVGGGKVPVDDWPLDYMGYLQSVGLAPTPTGSSPFQVLSSMSSYDFMSYCATSVPGNPLAYPNNAWVSVHNWNRILNSFGFGPAREAQAARPRARAAAKLVASLDVSASVDGSGHVTIVGVNPIMAPSQPASNSPYHLIATDSAGHTHADVPMLAASGHIDTHPAHPTLTLEAVVPAAGDAAVGVLANGATLATRKKSAHAPTVTIRRLPTFKAGNATVRWHAADRDHDALAVDVEYSGDGGRTWKPVWMGPNVGSARLPARYLFRSTRARVRVVVNDGFSAATAVSRRFSSPGAAPFVRILTPGSRLRQPNDAPLVLAGQAFDDQSRMLTGRRLRWMLGRRLLGTGTRITVSGLPAGRRRITLLARDRIGRTAAASIVIRLRAARPVFLALRAPRKLARKVRSVRLAVSSSLDATLVVRIAGLRAQRFKVGRRTRHVTVHIRRGSKTLNMRLTLGAGRLTRTEVVKVPRPAK